jgi:hypothetical protein
MCAIERKEEMHIENIPDGAKVAASAAAPVLTLMGVPLQEWTYVLSAIVSVLFIIEKTPVLIARIKQLIAYVKRKK